MESLIENSVKVTLKLCEKEALWLKALVQNPLCSPDDESKFNKEMRRKFWDALEPIKH